MKKGLLYLLLALSIVLASCRAGKEEEDNRIKVDVTILPYAGLVKAVGGDKVDITVLVPPQNACETYEPSPVDIAHGSKAELYFAVGAGYAFESGLLKGISENYKNVKIINTSIGIQILDNNPHVWLFAVGLRNIISKIYTGLTEKRPYLEEYFRKNRDKFLARLDSAETVINNNLAGLKGKKILVFHPSWYYFAIEHNLEQIAIEKEGKEPTAQDLKNIVNIAKKEKINTVFLEPNTNEESGEAVLEELKARSVLLNPMEEDVIKNLCDTSEKISKAVK